MDHPAEALADGPLFFHFISLSCRSVGSVSKHPKQMDSGK